MKCPYCGGRGVVKDDHPIFINDANLLRIYQEVMEKWNMPRAIFEGRSREARPAHARHELMYRWREETPAPFKMIGLLLGHRDHSTVIHGVEAYKGRLNGERCKFNHDECPC